MFAKLYETEVGQVLVTKDTNDYDKPCIRYAFESKCGLRISLSADYEDDSDESFDKRDNAFADITESAATNVAKLTLSKFVEEQEQE